ncbi:hypothetical protein SHELI_v1c00260 [Spiroplasma helicoides]|uniref:Lipoprotein n=1 Tax=Spiroplasma helicoides TaxID=216938 RepID=A0A1B3SJ72_9MOLU|nr:hypothetical protein [Spiroplasma helicoides]AOG59981.1 hypothetical protein SHELI_v1c00260 [Spiroplasma helicoides]
MKKLLSFMGVLALSASSSSAVLACGAIPSIDVKVLVDGVEFEKKTDKDGKESDVSVLEAYNNTLNKNKVLSVARQLLEAITFTKTKYQNQEKLNIEKELLGQNGINMSLNKYIDDNKDNQEEAFLNFKNSYTSSRNTNFTSINFDRANKKSIYNNGDSPIFLVKKIYKEKQLETSEIMDSFDIKNASVDDTTSNDQATTVNSGDKLSDALKVIGLSEDDAKTKYASDPQNPNDDEKKMISKASVLKNVETSEINLLGDFEIPTKISKEIANADKQEDDSYKPKINYQLKDEFKLHFGKDNKTVQSNATLIYSLSNKFANVELNFTDPNHGDQLNYLIKYTKINNIVINWGLRSSDILSNTSEDNRTDLSVYWYEPAIYQFKDEIIAQNNKNIFNVLGENFDPGIEISQIKS